LIITVSLFLFMKEKSNIKWVYIKPVKIILQTKLLWGCFNCKLLTLNVMIFMILKCPNIKKGLSLKLLCVGQMVLSIHQE
jgi:hypothetical protein